MRCSQSDLSTGWDVDALPAARCLIRNTDQAVAQVIRVVKEGKFRSRQGTDVEKADNVCIHGDSPRAVQFAGQIRWALIEAGIAVKPVGWA